MVPTRATVREWLSDLARGRITREEASELARPWVTDPEREAQITDLVLFEPLARLLGADLPTTGRPYLYGPSDFEGWLTDFERSEPSAP